MNDIVFPNATFQKAVICPEEEGIYKATINGKSFYILVEDSCINDIRIKWLGVDGIYKHGTFLWTTQEKWNSKESGEVEVFNNSLSEAVARASVISKDNTRTITLHKTACPNDIFKMYMDLSKSPKVYLNVGDLLNDIWIEIKVKWQPILNLKKSHHTFSIDIELPEDYIQSI